MNGNEYGTHTEGQSSIGIGIQTGGMGPQTVRRSLFSQNTWSSSSLCEFSQSMVTVLINEVKSLLDFEYKPGYHSENLELATVLLDEAVKYNRIYPHARSNENEIYGNAARLIKNWITGNGWKEVKRKE